MIFSDTNLNQTIRPGYSTSSKANAWSTNIDTMFIYCCVLDSKVVANTTASLLATLPNGNRCFLFNDKVTSPSTKMRYYPVAKRCFHTIQIDILTYFETPVAFGAHRCSNGTFDQFNPPAKYTLLLHRTEVRVTVRVVRVRSSKNVVI